MDWEVQRNHYGTTYKGNATYKIAEQLTLTFSQTTMIIEEHSYNKIRILEVVLTIAFYGGKRVY